MRPLSSALTYPSATSGSDSCERLRGYDELRGDWIRLDANCSSARRHRISAFDASRSLRAIRLSVCIEIHRRHRPDRLKATEDGHKRIYQCVVRAYYAWRPIIADLERAVFEGESDVQPPRSGKVAQHFVEGLGEWRCPRGVACKDSSENRNWLSRLLSFAHPRDGYASSI